MIRSFYVCYFLQTFNASLILSFYPIVNVVFNNKIEFENCAINENMTIRDYLVLVTKIVFRNCLKKDVKISSM